MFPAAYIRSVALTRLIITSPHTMLMVVGGRFHMWFGERGRKGGTADAWLVEDAWRQFYARLSRPASPRRHWSTPRWRHNAPSDTSDIWWQQRFNDIMRILGLTWHLLVSAWMKRLIKRLSSVPAIACLKCSRLMGAWVYSAMMRFEWTWQFDINQSIFSIPQQNFIVKLLENLIHDINSRKKS